jgi:hypothetical protein
MMQGLVMFENGTTGQVEANLYPARESFEGPVEVQVLQPTPALKHSAQLGAIAAFNGLLRLGLIDAQQRHCVLFNVTGLGGVPQIIGNSAGLLFAVMFAGLLLEQLKRVTPGSWALSMAATGEVSSIDPGEPVKGIGGLQAKVRAGLQVLKRGDKVIYPAENDDQIGDVLRKQAEVQGVFLFPVTTVYEALTSALGLQPTASVKERPVSQVRPPEENSLQLRPLTEIDIQALRQAGVIFIEWDREDSWGRSCALLSCSGLPPEIDPSLEGYPLLVWSCVSQIRRVREEMKNESWEPRQATVRISWKWSPAEFQNWHTIAESCLAGDLLHLYWRCDVDTTTEQCQEGLCVDALDIVILRRGEEVERFRLVTRMTRWDSPQRMFRFLIHKFHQDRRG